MGQKQKKQSKNIEEIQELKNTLQRLQADFENFKKREEKEKQKLAHMTTAAVIHQLLPIVDAVELALKHKENDAQFRKGVELIQSQLTKILKNVGVNPIDTTNQTLDPHKHEVLMQEEKDDCEDDTITQELQKGYMFHDAVLRTSKVKIARKKESKHTQGNTTEDNT